MRELKYKIKQTGGEPLDGDPYVILITDLIQEFETHEDFLDHTPSHIDMPTCHTVHTTTYM